MNLKFEFNVDKEKHIIYVTREFAANLDLVWDAFSKPEILDQWFAPKPWRARTKEMNFSEGGHWLYAMVSPENAEHWGLVEFLKVQPKTHFTTRNSFCDENGENLSKTYSIVENSFKEEQGITTVLIEKKFDTLASLEMLVNMGYIGGLSMAMTNLDELFALSTANK